MVTMQMKKYLLPISFLTLIAATFDINQSNEGIFQQPKDDLQLYLPDDLEATLWAESPMFFNPTNMDVDAKGRIWVTEAVNYRNFNNDSTKFMHHTEGDRVVILEDTNQDGKADKSTVFVEDKDLISPLGIAVIGNKTVVSCAPNLIVYTDENGDDKPDKKEILLTGFGGKDHDHSLHSVVAGPDGKWYFNVGNAGPHIVTDKSGFTIRSGSLYTGGSPYNEKNQGNQRSDDGKIWVGGLQMRMNPDGTGLEVLSHNFRNAYETYVDGRGDMWQNDNDDQVVTCRASWLMEGGNAGYFSADGTRYWQADQRPSQDMFTAHWHQEDPGVMCVGDNTGAGSPTGVTLNEGDALGEKYRGMFLSADAGRNTIFSFKPEPTGAGYNLAGKRNILVTSTKSDDKGYVWNDANHTADLTKWFRPSDVTIGTDGAIYIADWYDAVVGGHQMKDQGAYGRIYRITPKGKKLIAPKFDDQNTEGPLAAFKNPAANVRNLAFEKLKAQGEAVIPQVKTLISDKNPYVQTRAVYLLSQLGNKGKTEVESLLNDPNEQIRLVAFKALRLLNPKEKILPLAQKMVSDKSFLIKREVGVSIQGLPLVQTKDIILDLIKNYDGKDSYMLEAVGLAAAGKEEELYPTILAAFPEAKTPEKWSQKLTNLVWRLHPVLSINDLKSRANTSVLNLIERKKAITALAFIKHKTAAEAMLDLSKSKLTDVSEQSKYWLSFRQSNDWFDLLDWSKTGLNLEQEKKLAEMKRGREKMLNEYVAFWDRKNTAQYLAKDSVGGQILIGMASEKKLPQDLMPVVEEVIFSNPNQAVRVQASQYFKRPGVGKVFNLQNITGLKPNGKAGQKVFSTSCATCHKVGKEGMEVGPELTLIKKKFDKLGLLDAIINPSGGIVFGYEGWLINKKDGDSVYGFLVADGEQAVVVKDVAGQKHTIATKDISSRKKQDASLMPDPTMMGLSEKNLADLTEYLLTLKN
jgi:putative membrane-bound dehydrogenase-like protein